MTKIIKNKKYIFIMRLLRILTLSILFFCQTACYGQENLSEKIIGKWVGTARETINGRKTLNNGRPMKEPAVYEFRKDGSAMILIILPGEKMSYSVKNDILTIGSLQYVIEKVTERELVLLDYKNGDRKHPLAFRHFFSKSK